MTGLVRYCEGTRGKDLQDYEVRKLSRLRLKSALKANCGLDVIKSDWMVGFDSIVRLK